MFAHRTIQPIESLHIDIELPPEFANYQEAEVLVLPATIPSAPKMTWEERVRALAGTLTSDFPDDVDASDLGLDIPRASVE